MLKSPKHRVTLLATSVSASLILAAFIVLPTFVAAPAPIAADPQFPEQPPILVRMSTSLGDMTLELYPAAAPASVANFLAYVNAHTYDGEIIDRTNDGLAHCGMFNVNWVGTDRIVKTQVADESGNGLSNLRGTITVATSTPENNLHPVGFYFNLRDNQELDDDRPVITVVNGVRIGGFGMNVFGRVVEGVEVLDLVEAAPTGTHTFSDGFVMHDVPLEPIVINSIQRL